MRFRILRLLALLVLLGLLQACDQSSPQEAAKVEEKPVPVTVYRIEPRELGASIAFTGRIEATDKVELRARVDGFLEKRLFTEGSDVRKGDLLFVIEKAPYETAVSEVRGAIESAEATLLRTEQEYERQLSLTKSNVSAQARLEDAVAARDQARGNLAQLKARLERATLELGYTDIVAPIDGRIGQSRLSVGNFVGPSSGALATIVSQDPIYVSFSVTQREILAFCRKENRLNCRSEEAVVRLRLADGSIYDHPGTIDFIDVTVNQGTDAVKVRARFPNPERLLVDGQLVSALLHAAKPQMALMIPQAAIQVDQSGTFALAVNKENRIEVRRLELGQADGASYAVRSGLAEGDLVVTEGVQKV
ncbi:MAG: efflux RND transporter periplasmic adaptor subunit, partial [Nitratireductor sp.]|nr:efflux RND transporter periplasmic adaptor subunit [Nitratireductor sp.]